MQQLWPLLHLIIFYDQGLLKKGDILSTMGYLVHITSPGI